MHNPHEVIVCALVGPEAAEGCRRPVGSEEEEEEEEEKRSAAGLGHSQLLRSAPSPANLSTSLVKDRSVLPS